jgi:uncharacterized protein (DUF305 family)
MSVGLFTAAGCSADKANETSAKSASNDSAGPAPAAPTPAPPDTHGMQMAGTGHPDHDFLRRMSDHHHGMIQMVHATIERKDVPDVMGAAKKMDASQDAELDVMVTMLEKDFKDPYAPMLMPDAKTMGSELASLSGKDYEKKFLENTIMHHKEGIRMIDEYLPKSSNPQLKQLAEKMKTEQAAEVAEYTKTLARLAGK